MRRKDREITDKAELREILAKADACTVALVDGDKPYAVTLNYGFEWETDLPTLYFHCASAGRKLDVLAKNPAACVALDVDHELETGPSACDWGMKYRSLVIDGRLEIVTDPVERKKGLDLLMEHYSGRREFPYVAAELMATVVLRMRAIAVSGKKKA